MDTSTSRLILVTRRTTDTTSYRGAPYYGYGGIYTRNIIVRGRRHSGGYGRQHFSRYRSGRDRAQVSRPSQDRRGNPSSRPNRDRP